MLSPDCYNQWCGNLEYHWCRIMDSTRKSILSRRPAFDWLLCRSCFYTHALTHIKEKFPNNEKLTILFAFDPSGPLHEQLYIETTSQAPDIKKKLMNVLFSNIAECIAKRYQDYYVNKCIELSLEDVLPNDIISNILPYSNETSREVILKYAKPLF